MGTGLVACFLAVTMTGALQAQARSASSRSSIHGRVVDHRTSPVSGATVEVRTTDRGATDTVRTRTDSIGRYAVAIPGSREYVLTAVKEGYVPASVLVAVPEGAEEVVQEVHISPAPERSFVLEGLVARAPRRAPPPTRRGEAPGSTLSSNSGSIAASYPGEPGDLAGSAGISGQYVPVGNQDLSIAGQPASENRTTLDGSGFDGKSVPPEALGGAGVTPHPYDVSRGQFTGGEIAGRTMSGTNLWGGAVRLSLQPPFQYGGMPAPGSVTGLRQVQMGGGGGGPIVPGRLFVYGAGQLWSRSSFISHLDPSSPDLPQYRISSDSLERFYGIVQRLGYDTTPGDAERQRRMDSGAGVARFDYLASAHHTLMLRLDARGRRSTGLFGSPFAAAGDAREESFDRGALLQLTSDVGGAQNELNAYRSMGAQHSSSVHEGPAGEVWVGSDLGEGQVMSTSLSFGGNPLSSPEEDRSSLEVNDRLVVPLRGQAHQLQVGGSYSVQRVARRESSDRYGTFVFASLAELEAGRAMRFTRSLGVQAGQITTGYAAGYVGDLWRVGDGLRIAFGIRGERRWYAGPPNRGTPASAVFGLNGVPSSGGWDLSPRLGLTWVRQTPATELVMRGGTGEFQGAAPTRSLAAMLAGAGATEADVRLVCIGPAVPRVDWRVFIRDPEATPSTCAAGAPGTYSRSHGLVGFTPDYTPPRVWHSSVDVRWQYRPTQTALEANLTLSRGRGLSLAMDRNLRDVPYFNLASEAGRPVYVLPSAIDASSGQVTPDGSRRVAGFGIVREVNGSGRSTAGQLSLGISQLTPTGLWRAYYTFSRSRDQRTGLAGPGGGWATTAGDPQVAEWAASDFDQRHALQLSGTRSLGMRAKVTLIGRLVSGTPFTPLVDGDSNGDGLANDQAFIFDPGSTTDQEIRRGMEEVFKGAPASARSCLLGQVGTIAAANSCRTPWRPFLDVQLNLSPGGIRNRRLLLAVVAQNATAGLDYLMHGPDHLRGWGQYSLPDPVLLRTRGFDPGRAEFRYQVNPNFGRQVVHSSRTPFTLRFQGRIAIGADPASQALVASVAEMQANLRPSDVRAEILRGWRNLPVLVLARQESLGLDLTEEQTARLRLSADSITQRLGGIADALASAVSSAPSGIRADSSAQGSGSAELVRGAQVLLDTGFDVVRSVLTPVQWAKLPRALRQAPRATYSIRPQQGILLLPDL